MYRFLIADDLRVAGLQPDFDQPAANLQDGCESAYCTYTRASGANGGIEFDIFVRDDPVGIQATILGEAEGNLTPTGLEGVEASLIGTQTSGGVPFATILVRKGHAVFTIAIPPGSEAHAQLTSLARTVLGRLNT